MGFVADVGGVAGAVGFQDAPQGAQLIPGVKRPLPETGSEQ
jgi:hypothetical protein